jgi:hypothetical protein
MMECNPSQIIDEPSQMITSFIVGGLDPFEIVKGQKRLYSYRILVGQRKEDPTQEKKKDLEK